MRGSCMKSLYLLFSAQLANPQLSPYLSSIKSSYDLPFSSAAIFPSLYPAYILKESASAFSRHLDLPCKSPSVELTFISEHWSLHFLSYLLSYPAHPRSSCSNHNPSTYLKFSFPTGLKRDLFSSTEQSENSKKCWACGEIKSNRRFLICPSCKALQYPDPSINFFQIFDLDPNYEMDLGKLEASYKNLMKKLHPDLCHRKSEEEQANSAALSAIVTRAYRELLKPISRATYLLQLQGIQVEEEGTVDDRELLMEVMDMREALEETSDHKALEQLYTKAKSRMEEWERSLVAAFNEGRPNTAVAALQRMSYYNRLSEELKRKLF